MKTLLMLGLTLLMTPWLCLAQVTVIKAGTLIDPERGTTATRQVIVVEGARIKAVGTDIPIPLDARLIDLSDAIVLPGLFDAHTHLCIWAPPQTPPPAGERQVTSIFFNSLTHQTAYRALRGFAHAREMLEAGFTTLRDLGACGHYGASDLRRAIENHLVFGPTIVNAGRIIAPYGGAVYLQPMSAPGATGDMEGGAPAQPKVAARENIQPERQDVESRDYVYGDTPEELRKLVREDVYYGARVIKIVVDDQPYIYSADDIAIVVKEAARAGLKVAAYCRTDEGARNAIRAGVASIESGLGMTDDTLVLARKHGVTLVPIPISETALGVTGWTDARTHRARSLDTLRRAYMARVAVAFGSDVALVMPDQTRGTLALSVVDMFVEAGLPPGAILRALTANASRLLGVDSERGALRPGQAADIIATRANPLEDPQALKRVTFVMKEGQVVRVAVAVEPSRSFSQPRP